MSDEQVRDSDVFISYCESDDVPLAEEDGPGRVTLLCEALAQLANIDLDRELRLARPGRGSPSEARVLLVVISPEFVGSVERMAEVKRFAKAAGGAEAAGDLTIAVALAPTEVGGTLDWLQNVKTLDLFDAQGRLSRGQLNLVAGEVAETVVELLARSDSEPEEGAGKRVFLAHTDPASNWARDRVRAELEAHGYTIVPKGLATWDPADPESTAKFTDAMRRDLEGAALSAHILGDRFDDAAAFELGLAAERSDAGELTRLVWIEPAGDPSDPRLKPIFDSVETAPRGTIPLRSTSIQAFAAEALEVLEGRRSASPQSAPEPHGELDSLREALLAALREVRPENTATRGAGDPSSLEPTLQALLERLESASPPPAGPGGERFIYLLYDVSDQKKVDRLKRHMQKCGFEVWSPLFSDDSAKNAERHREYLEHCDASLVVYGDAPGEWWHALQVQWKKLRYWRRSAERLPRGYYFTKPFTPEKLEVPSSPERGIAVIRETDRFSAEVLEPFLQLVRPAAPET